VAGEIVDDPGTYQRFAAGDSISYAARADGVNVSLDNVANDGAAGEADNVVADVESVTGGQANDTLTAGGLSAGLSGSGGDDFITGGAADDGLSGGAGSDSLSGGAGDDFMDDGDFTSSVAPDPSPVAPGNDTLDGGPGNDSLSTDRGADNMIGGAGRDSASFSRVVPQAATVTTPNLDAGFTISLDDVANDGVTGAGEGDNVHSDVENIDTNGRAADAISGSPFANVISTGQGNDVIDPGAGADTVFASDGDDAVSAVDATTDTIDCGRGNDAANVDLAGAQPTRADVTFDCEAISGQAFGAVQPAIDTRKPVLKLSSKTVKVAAFRKNGRLPVKVTCSKACSLSGEAFTTKARIRVTALTGQFKVGAGHLKLGVAGKARTLNTTIAKRFLSKYRRQLRTKAQRKRGLAFRVTVTASDALGIQASATRTIKVRG
jgi:Ca2+-binding RTX toxin-like protein